MTECTRPCISTPLAWFTIEQYRLGDLDRAAAAEIARHLENCPACAEVHDYIKHDESSLPLLPMRMKTYNKIPRSVGFAGKAFIGLSSAACILFALLTVFAPTRTPTQKSASTGFATKGGDLAFSMVRLRGETVIENPTQFEEGDLFRLLITTPYEKEVPIEVAVFQGGETFFPFAESITVEPGNNRGLECAFILSGKEDALVCIIVGIPIPSREILQKKGVSSLPSENSLCQKLKAR